MPEVNFAVTDGGGIEHPVIANARRTPVKVNNERFLKSSDGPMCVLAVDGLQAPALAAGRESGFRAIQQILTRVRMSALAYISELDLGG